MIIDKCCYICDRCGSLVSETHVFFICIDPADEDCIEFHLCPKCRWDSEKYLAKYKYNNSDGRERYF